MLRWRILLKLNDLKAQQHNGFPVGGPMTTQPIDAKLLNRFISRVNFTGYHWLWTGRLDRDGYGGFDVNDRHTRAHRVSYQFFNGDLPAGCYILHTCHIRRCVHPDHLYAGTHQQNMQDRDAAGHASRQGRPGHKRIPTEALGEICGSSSGHRTIARKYGISPSHVANIRAGRRRGCAKSGSEIRMMEQEPRAA